MKDLLQQAKQDLNFILKSGDKYCVEVATDTINAAAIETLWR